MKRLAALEGLRGYAAFLVFLVHSCGLVLAAVYSVDADHATMADASPAVAVLLFFFRSHYGVDLFFVLSGLLMADIAARRWPGTRIFFARRALRIYPAYLASLGLALAAGIVLFGQRPLLPDIAANLAFLQGFFVLGIPALNPVTWSLSYEAAFYLSVPLLALAAGRLPGVIFPIAFLAIIALADALPGGKTIYFGYFALFAPGLWIGSMDAAQRERYAKRLPAWVALGAWTAFALAFKLEALSNLRGVYFIASGIAGGLLVLKLCDGSSLPARCLSTPGALFLGRISYSFFLLHYVILHVIGRVAGAGGMPRGTAFAASVFIGGFAASALAAWALYGVAERFYFVRRGR